MIPRSNSRAPVLTPTRMDPHDAWSRRARGWEKWEPLLTQALSGVDPVLFRDLALGPNTRVVDFACGTRALAHPCAHAAQGPGARNRHRRADD
jgi:hypothetical protein